MISPLGLCATMDMGITEPNSYNWNDQEYTGSTGGTLACVPTLPILGGPSFAGAGAVDFVLHTSRLKRFLYFTPGSS